MGSHRGRGRQSGAGETASIINIYNTHVKITHMTGYEVNVVFVYMQMFYSPKARVWPTMCVCVLPMHAMVTLRPE